MPWSTRPVRRIRRVIEKNRHSERGRHWTIAWLDYSLRWMRTNTDCLRFDMDSPSAHGMKGIHANSYMNVDSPYLSRSPGVFASLTNYIPRFDRLRLVFRRSVRSQRFLPRVIEDSINRELQHAARKMSFSINGSRRNEVFYLSNYPLHCLKESENILKVFGSGDFTTFHDRKFFLGAAAMWIPLTMVDSRLGSHTRKLHVDTE